ncbi:MAG TPA: polymer-forming cytoskeletal protein [Patescibacteria group bacterium]|nr:polymer-forming cytoskeletal protein [Patescibacteria group bacterium]
MLGDKRPTSSGQGTVIGANVKLIGTLQDANDIVVHGRIEGEIISSQAISITESSYVKGPISADLVTIAGKVRGSITATGKLEILPTGRVYGSITSKDLSVKSGAIFVGKSTMPEGEEKEEEEVPQEKETQKEETSYEVE